MTRGKGDPVLQIGKLPDDPTRKTSATEVEIGEVVVRKRSEAESVKQQRMDQGIFD